MPSSGLRAVRSAGRRQLEGDGAQSCGTGVCIPAACLHAPTGRLLVETGSRRSKMLLLTSFPLGLASGPREPPVGRRGVIR